MKKLISLLKKKWLWSLILLCASLSIYPLFVLSYTWFHVANSDLEGGRHGKLDAYRHSLASAVVTYTIGGWAVELVNSVFEEGGLESNAMDKHNNRVGIQVGNTAESFADIEPAIRQVVMEGQESATQRDQITWLSREKWKSAKFW